MKKILVALLLVVLAIFFVTGCNMEQDYTVTFDSNGGTAVESQVVKSGEKATEPTAPTKEGYTFVGWFVGDTAYDFEAAVTEDVTVKAKWTQNTYNVTFDTDGGSAVDSQTVTHGQKATEPTAPTKAGYTFVGWFVGDTAYDFEAAVAGDVTIKAKWTQNTYTVTFDADNGTENTTATVAEGAKVEAPVAPTKVGYAFVGWYLGDNAYDFETAITGEITLKAVWTLNQYTVTFDADNGTENTTATVAHGGTVAAPTEAPTKEGYTFVGWFVGENAYNFESVVTGEFTIKAVWEINKYTVSFDSNGGSAVEDATVEHGQAVAKPTDPTKRGYTFVGWFVGETAYNFETPVTDGFKVVAKWVEAIPDLSKLAGKWTGTENGTNYYEFVIKADGTVTASYENSFNTVVMNKNFVLFDGEKFVINYSVSTSPDAAEIEFVFSQENYTLTTNSAVAGSSLTLTKTYTVTFDTNGANKDKEYTVTHGSLVTEYKPSRTGYDLKGWLLNDVAFDITTTPITSDITLVAQWEVKMLTLKFYGQDGVTTLVKEFKVAYNSTLNDCIDQIPTEIPTTDGFKFNGKWYTTIKATSPASMTSKITSDKEYFPGLIAPMNDIEGTWNGTDKNGIVYKMVVDATNTTVTITTTTIVDNNPVVTQYIVKTILYKEIAGASSTDIKLVIRYVIGDSTSESTLTLTYNAGKFEGSDSLVLEKEGKKVTVTFDSKGGTQVDPQTIVAGDKATEPEAPKMEGFEFDGWYNGDVKYDFATAVDTDITLVAKWKEITNYKVTFNLDGGELSGAVLEQSVAAGALVVAPDGTPTKSNYVFKGWYLDGAEYNFATPVTRDITLVAKWVAAKKVTFIKQDNNTKFEIMFETGKTLEESITDNYVDIIVGLTGVDKSTVVKPATFEEIKANLVDALRTIKGSTFIGMWTKSATGTTEVNFSEKLSGTYNIYANFIAPSVIAEIEGTWIATKADGTVTGIFTTVITRDDAGKIIDVDCTVTIGEKVNTSVWVRTTYSNGQEQIHIRYQGTSSLQTYTIKKVDSVWQYSNGNFVKDDGGPKNFVVSFDSNGANAIDSQTVVEGETATAPTAPTKLGFAFAGWYIDDTAYDFNTPVTKNITVEAKWTLDIKTADVVGSWGCTIVGESYGYETTEDYLFIFFADGSVSATLSETMYGYTTSSEIDVLSLGKLVYENGNIIFSENGGSDITLTPKSILNDVKGTWTGNENYSGMMIPYTLTVNDDGTISAVCDMFGTEYVLTLVSLDNKIVLDYMSSMKVTLVFDGEKLVGTGVMSAPLTMTPYVASEDALTFEKIAGTWCATENFYGMTFNYTFVINADGTGSAKYVGDGTYETVMSFDKWVIEGNKLILNYNVDGGECDPLTFSLVDGKLVGIGPMSTEIALEKQ